MNEDIPMEVELVVDHFYVFDNVAVFSLEKSIEYFPNFNLLISKKLKNEEYNDKIVFAAVTSDTLITINTFDSLSLFGYAIFDIKSRSIIVLEVDKNSSVIKSRILDILTTNITGKISIDIIITNPNFDVDVIFLVKYGFIEPILINKIIRLKYINRPPIKLIMLQINAVVASLKSNVLLLNMFIPKVVAITLSKWLKEINEASGNLSIVKYNNDGIALIGINSNNIKSGTEGAVELPEQYSPLVFHTHPDHITREFRAFISWPSGQDIMAVALSFMHYRDQLVHFVVSPEGLWTIHVTSEFQKILIHLRNTNAYKCSENMLNAIFKIFTNFETPRLTTEIEAIDRYNIGNLYLTIVKNYKLFNLLKDVPEISENCQFTVDEDVQLFDISLIKWKRFSEVDEGVYLTFDYISDIVGGLSPFFFPFS